MKQKDWKSIGWAVGASAVGYGIMWCAAQNQREAENPVAHDKVVKQKNNLTQKKVTFADLPPSKRELAFVSKLPKQSNNKKANS